MEAAPHPWPALGVLLVRDGLVAKEELEAILDEQRDARHSRVSGHQLGEILVARGVVTPTQVARLVAEQYELPFLDLEPSDIDLRVARLLSEATTRRLSAVPVRSRPDGSCLIAIAEPATVLFSDELRRAVGSTPHFAVVGPEAIEAAIEHVHTRRQARPAPAETADDDNDARGVVVELRADGQTDTSTPEPGAPTHHGPPLGALLLREGIVSAEELDRALTQQSLSTSWRLGEILVDRGVVTSGVVARLIAEQYELPYVELEKLWVEPAVAALLPREIAREFPAVPISKSPDGALEVAIADPTNVYYSDELHNALGVQLTFVVAAPDAIDALLEATHTTAALVPVQPDDETIEHEPAAPALDVGDSTHSIEAIEQVVVETELLPESIEEPEPFAFEDHPVEIAVSSTADEPATSHERTPWFMRWTSENADDPTEAVEPGLDQLVEEPETGDAAEEPETGDAAEEPETGDAAADDLTAALLAEVSESHELAEPTVDSEPEVPLALVVLEHADEPSQTEVESADEATSLDPPFALAEVEPSHETPTPSEPEVLGALDPDQSTADTDDLDSAIEEVVTVGASAVHFSPQGEWYTVRARIDGLVRELGVAAREDVDALVERVEASATMRVSVVPTKQGNRVVLFPHELAGPARTLAELGLTSPAEDTVRSALETPAGAVVVCGPVGSGTTTTLYAALEALTAPECVVASIEDPIARVVDGVDQVEVDASSRATLADGLRLRLAGDPDVVLVGEARDLETADLAFQAAFEGRRVLVGMRAPSAAVAARRLLDLGLDSSIVGAAVTCVIGQRLVRRVCDDCRETYYASDSELADLGLPVEGGGPRLLARGRGCEACGETGFRGRAGLFEILTMTDEVRSLVLDGASANELQRAAVAAGMQTLREEGVRLCLEGVTTVAEVRRILGAAG